MVVVVDEESISYKNNACIRKIRERRSEKDSNLLLTKGSVLAMEIK